MRTVALLFVVACVAPPDDGPYTEVTDLEAGLLRPGMPGPAWIDWSDHGPTESCTFIVTLDCYRAIPHPLTIDALSCDGCTLTESPPHPIDDAPVHDGYALMDLTAPASGAVMLHVDVTRTDTGEQRHLDATATVE